MESDDLNLLSSTTRYHSEIRNQRVDQAAQQAGSSHPSHYSRYDPQPIEVIEAWGLDYHLGNVIKYVVRAEEKGTEIRDLQKAMWYLKRKIQLLEHPGNPPEPDPQI
jgi:hypothetical protein